jgi:hypothetical protein
MINSALERQAKSTDEILCRLIEERDGKKLAQTNQQTSGTSAGGATMLNPSTQLMNHFHSRTSIECLTPTFEMSQQTTTSMFE